MTRIPPFAIRHSEERDLERIWDIRYEVDVAGAEVLPERGSVPPFLPPQCRFAWAYGKSGRLDSHCY